jgi:hypothetical protein
MKIITESRTIAYQKEPMYYSPIRLRDRSHYNPTSSPAGSVRGGAEGAMVDRAGPGFSDTFLTPRKLPTVGVVPVVFCSFWVLLLPPSPYSGQIRGATGSSSSSSPAIS